MKRSFQAHSLKLLRLFFSILFSLSILSCEHSQENFENQTLVLLDNYSWGTISNPNWKIQTPSNSIVESFLQKTGTKALFLQKSSFIKFHPKELLALFRSQYLLFSSSTGFVVYTSENGFENLDWFLVKNFPESGSSVPSISSETNRENTTQAVLAFRESFAKLLQDLEQKEPAVLEKDLEILKFQFSNLPEKDLFFWIRMEVLRDFYSQRILDHNEKISKERSKFLSQKWSKLIQAIPEFDPIRGWISSFQNASEPEHKPSLEVFLPESLVLPSLEYENIKKTAYTFRLFEQEEDVQARTYTNRLEDTEEFLLWLKTNSDSDSNLEKNFKSHFWNKGESRDFTDWTFVDIGPGLSNLYYPAVTSLEMANRFPEMKLVIQELPTMFDRFEKFVQMEYKKDILEKNNLFFLNQSGVSRLKPILKTPFVKSYRNQIYDLDKTRPLVIRACNSVDIYENFGNVLEYFESLGRDFEDQTLLIFWNQGIYWKPPNTIRIQWIGSISAKGFSHNLIQRDRGKEPAFRLQLR